MVALARHHNMWYLPAMPKPKAQLNFNQSERILALARQLAQNAEDGIPYGHLVAELIRARRIEVQGHL